MHYKLAKGGFAYTVLGGAVRRGRGANGAGILLRYPRQAKYQNGKYECQDGECAWRGE